LTIRKNMSIYDCLINRFNMTIRTKLPPIINTTQSVKSVYNPFITHKNINSKQSVEYVFNRFTKYKKDNFNDLMDFISLFKKEDNIKNAINLVIEHATKLVLKDIKEILNAKKAKHFIKSQKAHDIANFMGSNENIDFFLKNLLKKTNDDDDIKNIQKIMKNAKEMMSQKIIDQLLAIKSDNYYENVRKIMNGVINNDDDKNVYLNFIKHSKYPDNTNFALNNIRNNKYGQFYDNKSSTCGTFPRR
jgi:hypothetical protein